MAKKRSEVEAEQTIAPESLLKSTLTQRAKPKYSPFLSSAIRENQKTFGRENVFMGCDADKPNVGIPWPSFSLAWATDVNVFPLSKIVGLAGASQAQKSTLGYEFARWFIEYGGEGKLIETEGKYSPPLMRSMIGEHFDDRYVIARCESLQAAQEHITTVMRLYDDLSKSKDTLNAAKSALVLLTLDSMTGGDSEAVTEKIIKEGSVQPSVATMAKSWFGYLRYLSSAISGYPCSMVLINHLLDTVGATVPGARYTPGGKAQRFFSSLYFWITRIGTERRATVYEGGKVIDRDTEIRTLRIHTEKSSMGTEGRKLEVDFCWWNNEKNEQVSYFDWAASTCELLHAHQTDVKDVRTQGRRLRDVVDVTKENAGHKGFVYSSTRLGLEEVSAHELGVAVDNNPEILADLHAIFHIKQYAVWDGRMPAFTDGKKPTPRPGTLEELAAESPYDGMPA